MINRLRPRVGQWYNHLDKGNVFQVVALDEASGTIEIQDFDGGLDEVDMEEWRQMAIESAAAPEDWSGPLDDVEPDDLGYTDMQPEGEGQPFEAVVTTWEEIVENDDGQDSYDDLSPPRRRSAAARRRYRH